jgi:hypothetical protein
MTIEKTADYTDGLKQRKLFARMNAEITGLVAGIENVMTAANAMRLALGAATLTLAEVEALHVQQTHEKRNADAKLFESQSRLSELLDAAKLKTTEAGALIAQQTPKVQNLLTQSNRIATRDIVDNEPTGPVEGLDYVDVAFFQDKLACSLSHVRNLITRGAIPPHDAVEADDDAGGRPKFLWLRHKAAIAVQGMPKKGIAALV